MDSVWFEWWICEAFCILCGLRSRAILKWKRIRTLSFLLFNHERVAAPFWCLCWASVHRQFGAVILQWVKGEHTRAPFVPVSLSRSLFEQPLFRQVMERRNTILFHVSIGLSYALGEKLAQNGQTVGGNVREPISHTILTFWSSRNHFVSKSILNKMWNSICCKFAIKFNAQVQPDWILTSCSNLRVRVA